MIELIQFPWSPFCLAQKRILEYSGARFKVVNIPCTDRALVWRLTRQRYHKVPIIRDGKTVVFETNDDSQVIAKYLDTKLQLGLFPHTWEGVQAILWRHIEKEVEGFAFKLNDIYFGENVPARNRLDYIRYKERKFGAGCLQQWRQEQDHLLVQLTHGLVPYEQMLADKSYLLDASPRFVDFDLYGMLANFLYTNHHSLPQAHAHLRSWYERMSRVTLKTTRQAL